MKIMAFNTESMARQAYEARKQLQHLKIDLALISETHLKPYVGFYIPNSLIFMGLVVKTGLKGRTASAAVKGIAHTWVDFSLVLSVQATGVCIPTGSAEMFPSAVYKCLQSLWSDTVITETFGFRNKSIWMQSTMSGIVTFEFL